MSSGDGHSYRGAFELAETVWSQDYRLGVMAEMSDAELHQWARRMRVPVALARIALAAFVVPTTRALLCASVSRVIADVSVLAEFPQ